MNIEHIEIGNAPDEVNVIIEIPANASPVKYEVEKHSGALVVDRFMGTAMFYPANYGFVPHTLSEDGDPVDVLVVTPYPLEHGSVIAARPVGVLNMTDEKGRDAKIIAYPISKLTPMYDHIHNIDAVPELLKAQIGHFFANYKANEPNKWVKIDGFADIDAAKAEITASIKRYQG